MSKIYIIKGRSFSRKTPDGNTIMGNVVDVEVTDNGFNYHLKKRDTYSMVSVSGNDTVIWEPEPSE